MQSQVQAVLQGGQADKLLSGLSDPRAFLLFIFLVVGLIEYMDYIKGNRTNENIAGLMNNVHAERTTRYANDHELFMTVVRLLETREQTEVRLLQERNKELQSRQELLELQQSQRREQQSQRREQPAPSAGDSGFIGPPQAEATVKAQIPPGTAATPAPGPR